MAMAERWPGNETKRDRHASQCIRAETTLMKSNETNLQCRFLGIV